MTAGETNPTTLPFVTAVIPCRNEERFIARCLESIVAMDYPPDRIEVLVVDGMSEDRTRDIVNDCVRRYPRIRLLDNPRRILASAWNVGIRHARGDVIVALNAHTLFESDYIATCVHYLGRYPEADYVGGIVRTLPQEDTPVGRAVALVLSHPFGVGGSRFRTGAKAPVWSDTAAFGGYRREVFDEVGLFNEELVRSQDMELHLRLKKAGKRTLLVPAMVGNYYTRTRVPHFLRYCYINGFWLTYPLRFTATMFSLRHSVPMLFVASLVASLLAGSVSPEARWVALAIGGAYVVTNLAVSAAAAISTRTPAHLLLLPVVFASLHVLYGVGSLAGLVTAASSRRFWRNIRGIVALPERAA
jgi:cellulose synthase/poly-beta-1,6-N-acetylglucosamine synthase-like glycosyltransferase